MKDHNKMRRPIMKLKIQALLVIVSAMCLQTLPANAALTPEQEGYLEKAQDYLDDPNKSYAAYPVDMCGFKIPTKIDESLVEPFMKADAELKNYCEEVRTKISLICRDSADAEKEKVKKKIKKITCKLSSKPEEISFQFDEATGDFQAFFNTKASDIDRAVLEAVKTKIKSVTTAAPGSPVPTAAPSKKKK
jgi:hypothetical protein